MTESVLDAEPMGWPVVPESEREYVPLVSEQMSDDRATPFRCLRYVYDTKSGRLRMIEVRVTAEADRSLRKVIPRSESIPAFWPFRWVLTHAQVVEICQESFDRGITIGEAFVRKVGPSNLSTSYIQDVLKGGTSFWKPDEDPFDTISRTTRVSHEMSTGLEFDPIVGSAPTPTGR